MGVRISEVVVLICRMGALEQSSYGGLLRGF